MPLGIQLIFFSTRVNQFNQAAIGSSVLICVLLFLLFICMYLTAIDSRFFNVLNLPPKSKKHLKQTCDISLFFQYRDSNYPCFVTISHLNCPYFVTISPLNCPYFMTNLTLNRSHALPVRSSRIYDVADFLLELLRIICIK